MNRRNRALLRGTRVALGVGLLSLGALAAPMNASAGDVNSKLLLNIPQQSLAQALTNLAEQADLQILFAPQLVAGLSSTGLSGNYSGAEALERLLAGSTLEYVVDGADTVVIRARSAPVLQRTSQVTLAADANSAAREADVSQSSPPLEEIVVTAQKRVERLQDVPVSVSVLSASALDANRVTGMEQLQQVSPSISFTNSGNTRGQGVSVRGIGTLNFSDGVEPSVSTVIDGVVIGRSAATFFDFNDIERIEVLRGPQGTLFGKNSSAGLLNVVTARPNLDEASFEASASYASYEDTRLKMSSSVPLAEGKAALRLSGFYGEADGIVTNAYDGKNLNDNEAYAVRGKFLLAPSDSWEVYVIGDYSKAERHCCVSTVRSILPTTRYWGPTGPTRTSLYSGIQLGPDNRVANVDGASFNNQDSWGGSVEVNAEFGGQTFTSISAYREFSVLDNNDADGVPIDIYDLNNAKQHQSQLTQEFRLSSPADAVIEYVVGAFYFSQSVDTRTQIRGTGNVVLPPAFVGNQIVRDIDTENIAPFGQVTWNVTDQFKLIGGARYTTENIDARFTRTIYPGAVSHAPQLGGPAYTAPTLGVDDETDLSYRLGAQYSFTPDRMAYLTFTRGYKGPAVNLLNNLSAAIVNSGEAVLDPEIARNWELGLRTTLLDRMLTFNATVFHTQFDDFQAQTFNALLNSFTLDNAGQLITKGVEMEAVLAPTRDLSLSLNVAYTDTEVKNYITGCYPGQTAAQGCGAGSRQDVTGSHLTNSPEWAYSVSGYYNVPLGDSAYRGLLNLTYSYRSDVFFAYRDPNTVQSAYGLLNASIGVQSEDRRYRLTVFGRNLTDQHFASVIAAGFLDTSAAGAGYTQLLTSESRRTVGVEVGVRF